MKAATRSRGRPRHQADEIKGQPLSIRTTRALKNRLLKAAEISGRSLASEIEYRLVQSLEADNEKSPEELRRDRVLEEVVRAVEPFLVFSGYRPPGSKLERDIHVATLLRPKPAAPANAVPAEEAAKPKAKPKPQTTKKRRT
jgi:hypothetical protein